jgi:hypothetical protein
VTFGTNSFPTGRRARIMTVPERGTGEDPSMSELTKSHYTTVLRAMLDGRLVPLLGAGVNLCGRPKGAAWQHGRYLPSGGELAAHLARLFGYPRTSCWTCCGSPSTWR